MNVASAYLHTLDGRVRVKVAEVKGSPAKALEIESRLHRFKGVDHVTANPTTGNVLILYDPCRIGQREILDALQALGCLQENGNTKTVTRGAAAARQGFGQELAKTLVRSTMEFTLQRLVSALI